MAHKRETKVTRDEIIAISLVLAVSIVFRLVHYFTALNDPYVQSLVGDEKYYYQWALDIADGELMRGSPFFTTPLFAYFMGGLFRIFGERTEIVIIMNAIMGAASSVLIYLTARQLSERWVSVSASLLF